MKNSFTSDYITQYLTGKLSEAEQKAFEQQLAENAALRREVDFMRKLMVTANEDGRMNLKEKIQAAEYKYADAAEQYIKKKSMLRYRWIGIAASLMLLLGFGSYFLLHQPAHKKLYTQYFEAPDNTFVSYGRGGFESDSLQMLTRASKMYDQKDYQQAVKLFDQYLVPEKQDAAYVFLSAISQLKAGSDTRAKRQFSFLLKHNHFDYAPNYYLALIALKRGQVDVAKKRLQKSVRHEKTCQKKAVKLLNALSREYDGK